MLNIGIIEDNKELQEIYRDYFQNSNQINCILTTDTVESFLKWYRNYMGIQVILLDSNDPNFPEIGNINLLKRKIPEADIVVMTLKEDKECIIKALRSGANGYLLKNIPLSTLEKHLIEMQNGGSPLSPTIARRILEYFNPPRPSTNGLKRNNLTAREKLVTKMIIEGMSYKKISEQLGISYSGVNYYVKNIYKKLSVHSKGEMTKKYIDGMIEI